MAIFGMLAIRQFRYEPKPWWYIALHVTVLALASGVTVILLVDDIVWGDSVGRLCGEALWGVSSGRLCGRLHKTAP